MAWTCPALVCRYHCRRTGCRAMTALLVDPLLTAFAWVGAAMFVVTAIALVRSRHHLVDAQPPA